MSLSHLQKAWLTEFCKWMQRYEDAPRFRFRYRHYCLRRAGWYAGLYLLAGGA